MRYASELTLALGALSFSEFAPWALGFINTLSYRILISQQIYCLSHVINHFFCDLTALLKLSCSDTSAIEHLTFAEGVLCSFLPFFLIVASYVCIICSIMKIPSIEGRRKAFSTCSSHLTYSPAQDKLYAVFYTTFIPITNPIIYSLRNRDVKAAFRKLICAVTWFSSKNT
ncbi:hypothetical protein XELAEV_18040228mg [Xenopus laevis]|uniref:G-protein coupled receptors family 1 profile domain-containing protein n=1 Tax=Xenopus laevis TaxID=8355 RepID=A0A974C928_XENLA|nr:hypothetical protein XELAEV_18040228mg [Xenopus laevis]